MNGFVKGSMIVLALSVILVFVSHSITFSHLEETIFNQYAIVRGESFIIDGNRIIIEPFYNRIMFPAVFVLFTRIVHGWSDVQAFLLLRFCSFMICLSLIYVAALRRCDGSVDRDAVMPLGAISLSMIPTFAHGWVHTSDILDLTLCLFMFLYLAEERYVAAFLVACLTAVNRETGAFAAVAYVCLTFGRQKPNLIAVRAVLIGFIPYLGAILVRKLVLGNQLALASTGQWYTGLSYNFGLWVEAIRRPSPVGWPMLLLAMMVFPWLLFLSAKSTREYRIRVGVAFFTIFIITAAVGINAEVRTFIPCVAVLIACGLANVRPSKRQSVAEDSSKPAYL
jgi:hypothetical protein